ncbi:GATA transcription factor 11-like [Bidens hawaiensis]|uniref:GATA transcription factor 11-like n=1 Tax=Bidens hawaiensis TaxID=980011 RepID=UPI004049FDD3
MASQHNNNSKMCSSAAGYGHGVCVEDDDCLGDWIDNILDFPVEPLDGDGFTGDWASKFGPIPSEVLLRETLPPVGFGASAGCGGSSVQNIGTYEPKFQPFIHKEVPKLQIQPQPTKFSLENKLYRIPKSFEAPSPDSVLERRTSSSGRKSVSFGTEIAIPVRTRTKRPHLHSRSGLTESSWSKSLQQFPLQKVQKKRRRLPNPQHDVNEVRKCSHCEITKTPQWREGPMGPKTLCNACGVRYRSGRLFPEYRPAASPTFVPSLHSNSHRKVVEMRQKGAMDGNYVMKKSLSPNVGILESRLCS